MPEWYSVCLGSLLVGDDPDVGDSSSNFEKEHVVMIFLKMYLNNIFTIYNKTMNKKDEYYTQLHTMNE